MNFKEAKAKLLNIADGKYCSLSHAECVSATGAEGQEYIVYIGGLTHFAGETWEEAFDELNKAMNADRVVIESTK